MPAFEAILAGVLPFVGDPMAVGQAMSGSGEEALRAGSVALDQIFLFLFMSLGPFNVIAPFAAMTRDRDAAFRRRLALRGTGIAAIALVVAATVGARILRNWEVSTESLLLTGGIILFAVALRRVMQQYAPLAQRPALPATESMAFSPLAFPTIVTPFGISVLVVSLRLRPGNAAVMEIMGLTALVLVLDLLAMIFADRILRAPFVASSFQILGAVMVVLQVALGIEVMLYGLRLLGVV